MDTTRLLIADDHAIFRQGLSALLQRDADMEVVGEASTGHEAIEAARLLQPDVVVMDLRMPECNGIEACKTLRELPNLRVIILSTSFDRASVRMAFQAGAAGFVGKASAFEELASAIRVVRSGKSYYSAGIEPPDTDEHPRASDDLTPREREVLQLLASGRTTKSAAVSLSLSAKTIETHRRNLMRKLDLDNLAELTKYAIRMGMTSE